MAFDLIVSAVAKGHSVILYTHRRMLFEQLLDRLRASGISPCTRAPHYSDLEYSPVCLAMIQTDYARSFKSNKIDPFDAQVVIVDECHADKGQRMLTINEHYDSRGATIVGLSATPTSVGHLYDDIVYAGRCSDLLKCGLHLPVEMYAPSEPDLERVHMTRGEYKASDLESRFQPHVICGSVVETYNDLNPDRRPTILFAPSVPGSRHISESLNRAGLTVAHLDGNNALMPDGTEIKSSRSIRDDLIAQLLNSDIDMISNRFVLREGIDIPELYFGILCTTFGLTSYIQACGRLLRAHPSLDHVRIADHGGNYWRHGYVNDDREWDINEGQVRQPSSSSGDEDDVKGWRCPNCFHVDKHKGSCSKCGMVIKKHVRAVRQLNGKLRLIHPKQKRGKTLQSEWDKYYYPIKNARTRMPFWVFADWFTEKTGYVIDRSGEYTSIKGRGETARLNNAPPPGSNLWRREVHEASRSGLQN